MLRRLLISAALGAAGCAAPGAAPPPLAWRLVDWDAGSGRRLALEPDEGRFGRVEIRLSKERAAAGDPVEAEIWLPGAEGVHRIEVRPSRPDVAILGPAVFEVEGSARIRVRFTCAAVGRGGIVVLVTE